MLLQMKKPTARHLYGKIMFPNHRIIAGAGYLPPFLIKCKQLVIKLEFETWQIMLKPYFPYDMIVNEEYPKLVERRRIPDE